MNEIKDLHRRAMDFAEQALVAQQKGQKDSAMDLFIKAYQFESKAAYLLATDTSTEPTRSILFRSAASLALDCNYHREAERLVAIALSGEPPLEIAEELRDLLEQINFQRHLEVKGIVLEPEEIQFSIAGQGVGLGITKSDQFVSRVQYLKKVICRTIERKMNQPFREKGQINKAVNDASKLYISVPRTGSFAVTLKLARNLHQTSIPGLDYYFQEIIDEIMECFDRFNHAREDEIKQIIKDESYYRNFIALATQIAPDGKDISMVGLTTMKRGSERQVAITRRQNEIRVISENDLNDTQDNRVYLKGQLKYADSTKEEESIKLIADNNKQYTIIVPTGMMSDIVKPLWEETVTIQGIFRGKKILLENIQKEEM